MIEYEKNIIVVPDNEHYDYEYAMDEIDSICEVLDLTYERLPMSGNDFGFGHAEKFLFSKKNMSEWTESEMEELSDEINERLH